VQIGRAAREQLPAVSEQHVERAVFAELAGVGGDASRKVCGRARVLLELVTERTKECAERVLAIGLTDRAEPTELEGANAFDRAVVGEHDMPAPQLPHEGVGVGQADPTSCFSPHVRDREQRLDWMVAQKFREGRVCGGVGL
jgi:hypothetical protein